MKTNVIGSMATCAMVMMLGSCSENNLSEQLLGQDAARTPMTFTVSQENLNEETRITYIERAEDLGSIYVAAEIENNSNVEYYFSDFFFHNNEGNYSAQYNDAYWPNDSRQKVTFYALNLGPDYNFLREAIEGGAAPAPLTNKTVDNILIDNRYFYQDVVAAYSVASANQTNGGMATLAFNHIMGEVEIYVQAAFDDNYPDATFSLTKVTITPTKNYASYHFDRNEWTHSDEVSPNASSIEYLDYPNGISVGGTYIEAQPEGNTPGSLFGFLIPGEYTIRVEYNYDADGAVRRYTSVYDEKNCTVSIAQGQKNRINLTLPALEAVEGAW